MHTKRLIVIGGGAAGFFCAVNAARLCPGLEVVVVEKTGKLLSKVRVSGGGRCNVTHACFSIADMTKKYPRGGSFLKKAFHHFFTEDTIRWFAERGVALKTESDGRMFPVTDSSQTIIDCLLKEANKYLVQIRMNREVKRISTNAGKWEIELANEEFLEADFVCVATGGYPKWAQYQWLAQEGIDVEHPVPSLFTFNLPATQGGVSANAVTALMGVTVEHVRVKIAGTKFSEEGPLLITHWGMSGPVVLKLSAWGARELAARNWEFGIVVNWLPDYNENSLREVFQQKRFELAVQKIANRNPFGLPNRLWEFLLAQSGIDENLRWADLPAALQNKLIKHCCSGEYPVKGKTTFKEEFVTAGGVKLSTIDSSSMQSKKYPGLFFAGEAIDVDGITGGFNFQNAWTTGWIAANAIARLAV